MKIVYSLGSIGFSGGIERVICTKTNYFADVLGYEVHIVVAGSQPKQLFFSFSEKIHFHYLDIEQKKRKPLTVFIKSIDKEYKQKLESLLFEIEPDITISTFGHDAEFLYQLKDGSKKILEFHFTKNYLKHLGDSLEHDKLRWIRKYWLQYLLWKEEQAAKYYQHIVVLTERDKQLWGGGDKFTVIPNPLSFFADKKASLRNKRIIAIGRLNEQKGFDLLMQAFALIKDEFPNWQVDVYGRGMKHHEEELHVLRNELSLEKQVSFKEPCNEIEKVFLNASIFAFSSRYEGFGLVLTEAMECGLPCVAFDCESGPDEIINHKKTGFLIPQENINLFAEALKKLMLNEELRITMGEKAKQEVTRFYPENVMPLWGNLFNEVLKK